MLRLNLANDMKIQILAIDKVMGKKRGDKGIECK
jgi:hypothetical protein